MFTIPSYLSHTLYNSLQFVLICLSFYHYRSMMQISTKWKQVIVAFVIVSIIIGLLSSYRLPTDVSIMREPKQGESRKTSSLENTCRLDPIVVRPESITLKMPPELEEVVPLWPNTRADKCIGNIKAKPMRKLSS